MYYEGQPGCQHQKCKMFFCMFHNVADMLFSEVLMIPYTVTGVVQDNSCSHGHQMPKVAMRCAKGRATTSVAHMHQTQLNSQRVRRITLAMPLAPGVPFLMLSALKSYLTTRPLLLLRLAENMSATIRSCNQALNHSSTN